LEIAKEIKERGLKWI